MRTLNRPQSHRKKIIEDFGESTGRALSELAFSPGSYNKYLNAQEPLDDTIDKETGVRMIELELMGVTMLIKCLFIELLLEDAQSIISKEEEVVLEESLVTGIVLNENDLIIDNQDDKNDFEQTKNIYHNQLKEARKVHFKKDNSVLEVYRRMIVNERSFYAKHLWDYVLKQVILFEEKNYGEKLNKQLKNS